MTTQQYMRLVRSNLSAGKTYSLHDIVVVRYLIPSLFVTYFVVARLFSVSAVVTGRHDPYIVRYVEMSFEKILTSSAVEVIFYLMLIASLVFADI